MKRVMLSTGWSMHAPTDMQQGWWSSLHRNASSKEAAKCEAKAVADLDQVSLFIHGSPSMVLLHVLA